MMRGRMVGVLSEKRDEDGIGRVDMNVLRTRRLELINSFRIIYYGEDIVESCTWEQKTGKMKLLMELEFGISGKASRSSSVRTKRTTSASALTHGFTCEGVFYTALTSWLGLLWTRE